MRKKTLIYLLPVVLLLSNSCSRNPVTGKSQLMLMSTQQEIAMGKQSDPDITSFFGIYEDPTLQKFIDEKGQQMAAVSHRKEIQYQFKIVDSPVVNAFAVPGGYVYFTRGIMAHFNNEAEFAGVLGHEIGHVAARHSAQQYSRGMLAQIGLAAGMILAPQYAQFGELAQSGVQLLFLKFGRDDEKESDKLGVEYSTKIGYDANEMADFFQTLDRVGKQAGGGEVPEFLSTHPDPANRYTKVKKLAADWKKKVNTTNLKINQDSYLKMIDGLIYGEDPKQGFVENSVFYHPVLKFQFPVPAQWALQNSPQQVQMAEPNGGAMIILELAQGSNLESAAQATLQKYQLTAVESKQENVNGLPAIAVIADQQTEQQSLRTLIYFIQYGGNIYTLLGVSPSKTFNNFFPTFQGVMGKFNQLTDQSKLNKQPERIRIKTVGQTTTLSQIFKQYSIKDNKMEELAILNGRQLNDKVEKGTLIKVLE
jgi:predicted Zn-dependent protease